MTTPAPRASGLLLLRWLFGAALLVALAVTLGQRWNEVRAGIGQLSWDGMAASGAASVAGIAAIFACWRTLLADLGHALPLRAALRVFFVGQLGKYLPGSVWPLVAQSELGRDQHVPRAVSAFALLMMQLVVLATGLAVALAGAPLLASGSVRPYAWVLAVLPVLLAVLHPAVANRLLGLGLRLLRRPDNRVRVSGPAVARAAGWGLLAWAAYGLHAWALAVDLGGTGAALLVRATAAFAGAWCVGFLLLVVPAGAGVREAALVLLLGPYMAVGQATVLALASRLVMTLTDVLGGALAVVARRRRREPGMQPVARGVSDYHR